MGYLTGMRIAESGAVRVPDWQAEPCPVPYLEALAAMEARVDGIAAGTAPELIWLLEHPAVITAGTSADPAELMNADRIPVVGVGRGGRYTYHGPGQRVVYVMLNLGARSQDIRRFVAGLEHWAIAALADIGIRSFTSPAGTGIWVEGPQGLAKIGAIGVRVRRWVSFHGLSINVATDLAPYGNFIPCGIREHGVTRAIDLVPTATMADLDAALQRHLGGFLQQLEDACGPATKALEAGNNCR
jgi:lipoyl(octanoyl) transferase